MLFEITRQDTKTKETFTSIVTKQQLDNISISQGLYILLDCKPYEEEQQKTYTYYYRLRPPMPGGQPKQGLVEINYNEIIHNNRQYWGTATYNRELIQNELYDYDLDI